MSVASASSQAPGVSSKSSRILTVSEEGNTRLMNRERRDSLRLINQTLNAIRLDKEDLTEICGFDELKNCRYLRTNTCSKSKNRKNSLLGFNEI